ncbi:MAG TPA: extracellular solute-binding protein [Caldilineaceae bacterium]|nr:extracellular solute-binding protein [Caldilineaceae bacterium]
MAFTYSQPFTRRTFLKSAGMMTVGAVALAACVPAAAPAGAPAGEAAAPATEGATVRFLGGPWSFLPELDVVIEDFANQWAAENNATVTFERDAQVLPKIQTAIETGSGANIIQYSSPPQIFANALIDVSDLTAPIGEEGGGYLPNASYQMGTEDGKWLGVPLGQHNWFINYRQDWLQEEGYDTFPDTWEEALVVGKALKEKGRPYGMTFSDQASGDGNGVPRLVLWAFGGKEFNEDGSLALDSEETLAALEFAIQLHNDAGDPGEIGYDDGANNAAFLASKLSMTANVNTIYLPATKNDPALAEAMNHALPPQGPAGRFGYGQLPWWGVLNQTTGADLDATLGLISEFFKMDNFGAFYKAGQGYILPLLPNYENEDIWPEDPKLAIAKDMFKLALPAGHALPQQTKLAALIQDKILIGKLFSQACSTGDARAALDGVMKDIADLELLA